MNGLHKYGLVGNEGGLKDGFPDLVNGGFSRYHILFRKSSVYEVYIMVFT